MIRYCNNTEMPGLIDNMVRSGRKNEANGVGFIPVPGRVKIMGDVFAVLAMRSGIWL